MTSKVKILLYCTKGKPYLYNLGVEKWWYNEGCYEPFDYREGFRLFDKLQKTNRYKQGDCDIQIGDLLNGKIVGECELEKVEEIHISIEKTFGEKIKYYIYDEEFENFYREDCVEKETCLKCNEISNYLNKRRGYFLHLSNVKLFDKPLSFDKDYIYKDYKTNSVLTKAPQNMCNVYDRFGNHYVLISVQPQHLCKILNGEKTIEIRKKILNCLKELI